MMIGTMVKRCVKLMKKNLTNNSPYTYFHTNVYALISNIMIRKVSSRWLRLEMFCKNITRFRVAYYVTIEILTLTDRWRR